MNDQERQVIADIFRRLEQVAHQPRDPETERFIADKVRQQPYAPYAMAQAIFVQEQALANLNAEVEHLRAEVEELRRTRQGGGLFSGLFGGGARAPEPPRHPSGSPWGRPGQQAVPPQGYGHPQGYGQPQGGPMGGQAFGAPGPWGGMQGRGGGGFLQTAMATAAGVAGGMMIGNALSNAFGGEGGGADAASNLAGLGGGEQGGDAGSNGGITDSLYQDASANDQDVSGGDDFSGGGDDWA
jgi:hypothetical protein